MSNDLDYIISHVFLPLKLPQKDDSSHTQDKFLTKEVLSALKSLQCYVPEQERSKWTPCIKMISTMLDLRDDFGGLAATKVEEALREMSCGDIVPFHIRSQNTALIVRRSSDEYLFEAFEVSPTAEAVIGTKGRLRRCFPGPAVAIDQDRVADASFLQPLTESLVKLDAETPEEALPVMTKARTKVVETRDTVHPKFVTEMLIGILRAIGRPQHVSRIYKHTRDEVLWEDALQPWRRCPLWLLLRVALQTSLTDTLCEKPYARYKSFMLFFMTEVLKCGLAASLPSDTLFSMTAKISRRALKLGIVDETPWMQHVATTIHAVQHELNRRWDLLEHDPDPFTTQSGWTPSSLSFLSDTRLTIPRLRPYISKVLARSASSSACANFTSHCGFRISQSSLILPDPKLITNENRDQIRLHLVDLEIWVEHSLKSWLPANMKCQNACTDLAKLIDTYITAASITYKGMPEDTSIMLLTSMDLWVALDKCAVYHCTLLHDYSPEFPSSLFEPLLLPKKSQMERLLHVEQYLATRRAAARPGFPSIFRSADTANSLAVRYVQQSPQHMELRQEIEAAAKRERARKKSELSEKRKMYHDLHKKSDGMTCQYVSRWRKYRQVSVHFGSCQKCQLQSQANGLTIDVHEWPLPEPDLEAKAAVFELDVPIVLSKWRSITYRMLVDILSAQSRHQGRGKQQGVYCLHEYAGLTSFVRSMTERVQLASTAKPFVVSHYRRQKISQANESNVCVNNGLRYAVYDSEQGRWTEELLGFCDVRKQCTPDLPDGPYKQLQYAVTNTIHTSNEMIAGQSECPVTLTVHEFYAFGTLRSGHRLQWRNIARELIAHTLDLSCHETQTLIVQAAWQAGPSLAGQVCRESHLDLEEDEFGSSLVLTLDEALGTIEDNWQSAPMARTLVALTTRLLSLSSCEIVHDSCFRILRRARAMSLHWVRQLGQKLQRGQDEEDLKMLNVRTLEMGLTCHGTFDVDLHYLPDILKEDEDIAAVAECSIIVHDRCPVDLDNLPMSVEQLLPRYWRLSCVLEPFLRQQITKIRSGLDITIGRLWVNYRPGSCWKALSSPSERWLVTESLTQDGLSPMVVHYNLLDGSLLVNGSPLTRLPHSYETHPTFRRIFSEKIFDVVPSSIGGMTFEAREELFDHQVFFGMYDSELVVRARKRGSVYELLPVTALAGDFPHMFVHEYVHWLHIDSGVVEWRPLSCAWISTPQNWHTWTDVEGINKILLRGSSRLVDIHTLTAKAVSRVLSPLEEAVHIYITFHCETEVLEVHLPRLKLDFFLRKGATELESKQFRGMTVDPNQSIGTLTGLVNKLILRGRINSSRGVIIPYGDIRFESKGHRVQVFTNTSSQYVSYHFYQVDSQLGRLVDNGNLRSKLFKCYLHAVTAHCLADELTGRTGTEEALSILASPSVQSSRRLDRVEIDLLILLARLTPRRSYYPQHLQVMQEVQWQRLSPISQHPSFLKSVQFIFDRVRTYDLFYDTPTNLPDANIGGNHHLLERACIRDATYRVDGFGAEHDTTKDDSHYVARDYTSNSMRESQVCRTARLVDCWSANLKGSSDLLREIESWGKPLCGYATQAPIPFGYDTKWLKPLEDFLPSDWCMLQTILSDSVAERDKYRIMIFLSTLTYSSYAKTELVQTLLAFATLPELRMVGRPKYSSFDLSHGYEPDRTNLIEVTNDNCRPFYSCPESNLPQHPLETFSDADERRREEHQKAVKKYVGEFVEALICQWPQENARDPTDSDFNTYIFVNEATQDTQVWFRSWYCNAKFKESIAQTQEILNNLNAGDQELSRYSFLWPGYRYHPQRNHVDYIDIMERAAPILPPVPRDDLASWVSERDIDLKDRSELKSLLNILSSKASGRHEQQYAKDMISSLNSLPNSMKGGLHGSVHDLEPLLEEHLLRCKNHVSDVHQTIRHCLQAETSIPRRLCSKAGLWPRSSTISLLQHLARDKVTLLRDEWKRSLITFGVALSQLQRAERLRACLGRESELLSELSNQGHQGWDPFQNPDWLLFEIENNILIRPEQVQIAQQMISPSSGSNSIMQLNMGEGKSSVIVPIVASTLADGRRLVRVVVLKPLSSQMFQMLLKTLAGLLGRRIFHMPISRSVQVDNHKARQIQNLCEECMRAGGILLVQPEHVLSFELMGLERLLSGELELGNNLVDTQRWLEHNSRDILDESDEILSVRFELIYTIGTQRTIELGSGRWTIIEHILGLVGRFAPRVLELCPHSLELASAISGRFSRLRVLHTSAADKLLEMLAREVCEAGLPGVSVWKFPQHVRAALFEYLTRLDINEVQNELSHRHLFAADSTWKALLLLKGLLAGGVLAFALQQKRWRVNYGLDLSRTMLAVPYRAKDSPATRAEFSHPDATIVLTCLSYYYSGLSDQQLRTAFEKLLLSDHAQEEYEGWVQDAPKLPLAFRQLVGVNLSDPAQCSQMIFPPLRYSKEAIDFYVSRIVFPKEMKEFPHKLSSSGWNIARTKKHLTTGFSGTNDSKYMLPLSIEQRDLPEQRHTNAAVLDYLLRSENSYKHSNHEKGVYDAESLLQLVITVEPPVRVILDVGAQVIDWTNEKVVREWLSRVPEAQAAVFFDDQNDLSVVSRDGILESLMVSPFAKQMDQCLVYLDEAHTRGTDLKLPTNYRAAVTLGPGLTKDRLVQACMRMRKLGKGQSVMICGPVEVERQIRRCSGKSQCDIIKVPDVLQWSISETCVHTKKCIPLWATQGVRYQRHHTAWAKFSSGEGGGTALDMAESLLEVEAQSLEDRYGFKGQRPVEQLLRNEFYDKSLSERKTQLEAIWAKCQEFELTSFNGATLREEQERELSPENEQERQVERPLALTPCKHSLHRDVKRFVIQGSLDRDSDAFQPLFDLFSNTSAAEFFDVKAWPTQLLVTADFARTVCKVGINDLDLFLRPVHWVISGKTGKTVDFVVVSPFEAHELLPYIRQHKAVTLHVYSPRVNISMRTLDDLSFCAIPAVPKHWSDPPLAIQLNLFAGQLYMRSYDEYLSVCRFLGLGFRPPDEQTQMALDGFVGTNSRLNFDEVMERVCPFESSPVEFLRTLVAFRRKEQSFQKSHLGRILHGDLLSKSDFQE